MPGNYYNLDPSRVKWQCQWYNDAVGGLGITHWSDGTVSLSPNSTHAYSFTGTHPKCYAEPNYCNIGFDFGINSNANTDDVGPLRFYMNYPYQEVGTPCYHSKTYMHDTRISIDLAPTGYYNDIGLNTLTVKNTDPNKYIILRNFEIHRGYQVCNLSMEMDNCCNGTDSCYTGHPCGTEWQAQSNGNLDATRADYPCNNDHGGMSYTYWHYPYSFSLFPGYYQEFGFTCDVPTRPNSYVGPYACLACIDQTGLDANASGNDVAFKLSLNNHEVRRDYHSKIFNHNIWPSIDLTKTNYYNDVGNNVFRIDNLDANRTIHIASFDIYRIYRTDTPPIKM